MLNFTAGAQPFSFLNIPSINCNCDSLIEHSETFIKACLDIIKEFLSKNKHNLISKQDFQDFIAMYEFIQNSIIECAQKIIKNEMMIGDCEKTHDDMIPKIEEMNKTLTELKKKVIEHHDKILHLTQDRFYHEIKKYKSEQIKKEMEMKLYIKEKNADDNGLTYLDQKEVDLILKKSQSEQIDKIKDIMESIKKIHDNQIKAKLEDGGNKINEIKENVNEAGHYMDKGTDESKKAAKEAIKNRSIKNKVIFISAFGLIGSVVPVVGNVLGAYLGNYLADKIKEAEVKDLEKNLDKIKSKKIKKK